MNFADVLKTCEQASGAGSKKVIKEALGRFDATSRRLMYYLFNPFYTFGVKKYDQPICHTVNENDLDTAINELFLTLDQLRNRELTGNAARNAVTDILELFTEDTAKYIARVIDKDPQAGFSNETYNKVWPDDPVPIFSVMLADKLAVTETEADDGGDDFDQIVYPIWSDVKYDGERNLCIVKETDITYLSRSGLEAEHMYGLFDEELIKIRAHLGYDFVMDGERMAASYIDTINAKKSGAEGEVGKKAMRFRVFFMMSLDNWNAQQCATTMRQNRANLTAIFAACECVKLTQTVGREVVDHDDMMSHLDEVTKPGYDGQKKGHEGLILKQYEALYSWDRSMSWCKVKKFYEVDVRIMTYEMGRKSLSHTIGRVNYVGFLEDGRRVEGGVGSGLRLKSRNDGAPTRDELLANWEKYEGTTMVLKYQEVSKAKDKQVLSLRFPTVFRFRDDKIINVD
jgi:DNA ligase-1